MTHQRVFITGAAGFIGSHLVDRLLERGCEVVGLDNFCSLYSSPQMKHANLAAAKAHPNFRLIEADITDRDRVHEAVAEASPQVIVHLAALAGVRNSIRYPDRYIRVNIDGTGNLLDAAGEAKVRHFVLASSSSVYGNNPKVPFSERDPVDHPISPYAATKKADELLAHTYTHLHALPTTCLRFFTVFGPRQRPDLAIHKFLTCARDATPIPMFGDGSTSRDYTYIDDIIAGVLAVIDRPLSEHPYRVYNLGGDEPLSLAQMIDAIRRVTGRAVEIEKLPPQPGDVERTWADITRAREELGYQPATSFEKGLERQWAALDATQPHSARPDTARRTA